MATICSSPRNRLGINDPNQCTGFVHPGNRTYTSPRRYGGTLYREAASHLRRGPVRYSKQQDRLRRPTQSRASHRPDRITVGEIRGAEPRVFLDALNTVHHGSITTLHANGSGDALRGLVHLAVRTSGGVTPADAEQEARASIDVVMHIENRWPPQSTRDVATTLCVTSFIVELFWLVAALPTPYARTHARHRASGRAAQRVWSRFSAACP